MPKLRDDLSKFEMEKLNFEEIYTTFEKPVYNYVLRMVKDAQVARDLVQEIFLKIFKNLLFT